MKIGLLTTSFPTTPGDLAGHFVLGFARSLACRGHEIEVLAPEPASGREPPAWDGVHVRWIPYLRPRSLQRTFYGAGVPDNLRRSPLAWLGPAPFTLQLKRDVARRGAGWDAVVSHWALPCGLVAAGRPTAAPHLAVMHSADVHALEHLPFGRRLARRVAEGADAMLFVSMDLRRRFLALLTDDGRLEASGKSHVCPMGVDAYVPPETPRRELRRELNLKGLTVLSMGRLIELKGIRHAIDAVANVDGAELVIAGEGPDRASLLSHVHTHTRTNININAGGVRVRFLGNIRGEEKARWLRAADVFVLPSIQLPSGRTEGAPNALIEAMDAGLPPVATRVGGVPELIEDGHSGLLVAPGDAAALQRALESLRDRATRKRMGQRAQRRAREFHWPTIAPEIEQLLQP